MAKTIAEVSQETLKIQAFLESLKPGTTIGYTDIAKASSVKMDLCGKQRLRTALKRARLEYSTIRQYGIRLADASTVMPILAGRLIKIDRAVKRGDKTQRILNEQFFSSLTEPEQRSVLFAGAVFGAIRLAASNGKGLWQKRQGELPQSISIPIPKIS